MINRLVSILVIFSLICLYTSNVYSQSKNCDGGRLVVPINDSSYCNHNNWVLVFEEDFDTDSLEFEKWQHYEGEGTFGDGEYKYFQTLDNVKIDNGSVKLFTKKEKVYRKVEAWKDSSEILRDGIQNLRWFDYTASTIRTNSKFLYGYFEARCKIPKGKGLWPAMWLYGNDIDYNQTIPGLVTSEIDVFEFWKNNTKEVHTNLHVEDESCLATFEVMDLSEEYHTYAVLWEPSFIIWYIDDEEIRRYTRFYQIGKEVECNLKAWQMYEESVFPTIPLSIYFSHWIDQHDGFGPDETTPFPSALEIDWIRFYQREGFIPTESINMLSLEIYPNPNSGSFYLKIISNRTISYDCKIYNTYGKLIKYLNEISSDSYVDLNEQPPGLYYLYITDPLRQISQTHKIMIR